MEEERDQRQHIVSFNVHLNLLSFNKNQVFTKKFVMLLCLSEDNFMVSTVSIASVINVVRVSLFWLSEKFSSSSKFFKACMAESCRGMLPSSSSSSPQITSL